MGRVLLEVFVVSSVAATSRAPRLNEPVRWHLGTSMCFPAVMFSPGFGGQVEGLQQFCNTLFASKFYDSV